MATIETRIYEGQRCKEILDNEMFQKIFNDIEQELFEAWKQSPVKDEAGRESIYQYQTMLRKIQTHLQTTLESGKLASLDLEHKRSLSQKLKNSIGWE